MKKFIENDIEIDYSSPIKFTQSVVGLILLAPYRLVLEISSKLIYLPKSAIVKICLYSTLIGGCITLANVLLQSYFGAFTLLKGKVPVIIMLVGTLVMLVLFFACSMFNFSALTQLEELYPSEPLAEEEEEVPPSEQFADSLDNESDTDTEPKPEQFADSFNTAEVGTTEASTIEANTAEASGQIPNSQIIDFTQGIEELLNATPSPAPMPTMAQLQPAQQPVTKDSNFSRLNRAGLTDAQLDKIQKLGKQLAKDELISLKEQLVKCTDPSEFLSARLLTELANNTINEDAINLEALNINVIPSTFKALA